MQIDAEPSIMYEINDHFSYMYPNAKHTPKFKAGVWDGYLRLFNLNTRYLYLGLYDDLVEFSKSRGYHISLIESAAFGVCGTKDYVHLDDVKDFVGTLDIHSGGNSVKPYDFQINGVYEAIFNTRKTIVSPTGSGKSLIIYTLMRWYTRKNMRVLVVVPSSSLVRQLTGDFKDYSSGSSNPYDVDNQVHQIFDGATRETSKQVVISTWQSLQKTFVPASWFNQFDVIIVDEVHGAEAREMSSIMEKCGNVKYRFGLTATLRKTQTNKMVIRGLFGSISVVATTRDLMDRGILSGIDIKCLVLGYNKVTKSLFSKKVDYNTEIEYLISHEKRNKFIAKLALSCERNTLVLVQRDGTHGKILADMIREQAGDRPVYYITGKNPTDEREAVRRKMETDRNAITVATYGVFSTGVNVKNIHNIISASPSKSNIRVLQSIGRGVRQAKDKTILTLYDVADILNKSKTKCNTTYLHLIERLKIYSEEEFEYSIFNIALES